MGIFIKTKLLTLIIFISFFRPIHPMNQAVTHHSGEWRFFGWRYKVALAIE